ncbi:MAG TPA: hypothetical protein VLF91_00040 [Candidatus Saccharimonadales bacterium]|nr:hypothetical protein [Candidatus Saccharimonadales bacterium]
MEKLSTGTPTSESCWKRWLQGPVALGSAALVLAGALLAGDTIRSTGQFSSGSVSNTEPNNPTIQVNNAAWETGNVSNIGPVGRGITIQNDWGLSAHWPLDGSARSTTPQPAGDTVANLDW